MLAHPTRRGRHKPHGTGTLALWTDFSLMRPPTISVGLRIRLKLADRAFNDLQNLKPHKAEVKYT
jgi:hypothetical protein